jgi:hypothetical protein
MKHLPITTAVSTACFVLGCCFALAQQPPQGADLHPMTFFITSAPIARGGNLGGLAGADAHCQQLAAAAGAGNHTWHAYLSTQARPGQPAVNARDRIGTGPWYNAKGVMIAQDPAHLHGDTLDLARFGNNITKVTDLTEKGEIVPGLNDGKDPHDREWSYIMSHPTSNHHEVLTGTRPDGMAYTDNRDHTCNNWTSDARGDAGQNLRENTGASVQVGMSDRNGGGNGSWNSAHGSAGCSNDDLARAHGEGMFYCFAVN